MAQAKSSSKPKRRWWIVPSAVLVLLLAAAYYLFVPHNLGTITSQPRPAAGYAEAEQRIQAWQATETADFNPVCRLQFMTHGQKVARAIVFVHGYGTCPEQFRTLGTEFYDLGYNVLIAAMPHNGLADRMTAEQARLTAEELAAYADDVVDIAQGLGEHVTLAGFSAGGVAAGWAAQSRSDVDLAVVISPGFGFYQVPVPLTAPVMNLNLLLPNSFAWFDTTLKEAGAPVYAYPRYSTRALAQLLRLSFATQVGARRAAPAARSILVITNANDHSVNNELTQQVVDEWRAQGAELRTYEFDAGLQLGHDMIDPTQPDQRTDIVYPTVIDLIAQLGR